MVSIHPVNSKTPLLLAQNGILPSGLVVLLLSVSEEGIDVIKVVSEQDKIRHDHEKTMTRRDTIRHYSTRYGMMDLPIKIYRTSHKKLWTGP